MIYYIVGGISFMLAFVSAVLTDNYLPIIFAIYGAALIIHDGQKGDK